MSHLLVVGGNPVDGRDWVHMSSGIVHGVYAAGISRRMVSRAMYIVFVHVQPVRYARVAIGLAVSFHALIDQIIHLLTASNPCCPLASRFVQTLYPCTSRL